MNRGNQNRELNLLGEVVNGLLIRAAWSQDFSTPSSLFIQLIKYPVFFISLSELIASQDKSTNLTLIAKFSLFKILFFLNFSFFRDFIYLFLDRGKGKEKGRETSMCGCLSRAPYWGPGLQPRHVP